MKNDNKKYIKLFIAVLIFLLFILILFPFFYFKFHNNFYKIESRKTSIEGLKSKNSDFFVAGWIRVQGTDIDYPIIYNESDHNLEKINTDYVWINSNISNLVNKISIYGHNIRNLSVNPEITSSNHVRFEQLPSFMYYEFAKKNKYIQLTIGDSDYLYKIFGVSLVLNSTLDPYSYDYSKKDINKYISNVKKDSFYNYDVDVSSKDKFLTLATCTRFYGPTTIYSFKIDARLVRERELIDDYDIEENENYKFIKEQMGGVEVNEA